MELRPSQIQDRGARSPEKRYLRLRALAGVDMRLEQSFEAQHFHFCEFRAWNRNSLRRGEQGYGCVCVYADIEKSYRFSVSATRMVPINRAPEHRSHPQARAHSFKASPCFFDEREQIDRMCVERAGQFMKRKHRRIVPTRPQSTNILLTHPCQFGGSLQGYTSPRRVSK